jgi:hypothetical protein
MQKDNSTGAQKASLRKVMLQHVETPVIMEAYAGAGHLWRACYSDIEAGIAFEKDDGKIETIAYQRPTWSVYQADCVYAIRSGAGSHLHINVLDLDPYGSPWPALLAFFQSERPRPGEVWIVVNDGTREKLKMGGAPPILLRGMHAEFGQTLYMDYLKVCQRMVSDYAAIQDYKLDRWAGYYCGYANQMTHYLAKIIKK